MGLLDQLAGQVLGSLSDAKQGSNPLLDIATQLIQSQGGIEGLLAKLQSGGLGTQADSWVSTGQSLPVASEQISNALGADTLEQLAGNTGLNTNQLAGGLASMLPQLIDQLTPNGSTAGANDLLSQGLGALLGGLKRQN